MSASRHLSKLAIPALLVLLLASGDVLAADTDVPQGIGIGEQGSTGKEGEKPKKPHIPAWQVPGATTSKFLGAVYVAAGTGWVTGKAYKDNPVTVDDGSDGPSVGGGMHDAGTAVRWLLGYVTAKGWLVAAWARLGLTRGNNDGWDDEYDAWMLGLRFGKIFYSKHNLDIFWFLGAGYGHLRHRVSDVPSPDAEPDAFLRRDVWPFDSRPGVDFFKKSGWFDADVGVLVIYRFTPVFNLVIELSGDFVAPDIAFNLDVAGGLAIAFP